MAAAAGAAGYKGEATPGDVFVGTAGYNYAWWRKGAFYPRGLTQSSELKHYSGVFSAVEINASFHGVPREETLQTWAQQVKKGFKFALKVPQDITHVKRLVNAEDSIKFFIGRIQAKLGDTLGPVLFQLPPTLTKDVAKIEAVADASPPGVRIAWEFRHASWYCAEVFTVLRKHNFAICENRSVDNSTLHTTEMTADWTYTRFHKNGKIVAEYVGLVTWDWSQQGKLKEAACVIADRRKQGLQQFNFFLNDHEANSPKNAKTLLAETSAITGGPKLVAGWKADSVVEKGGKGSIHAMFAGAAKKSAAQATNADAPRREVEPLERGDAKRAKVDDGAPTPPKTTSQSPAKSKPAPKSPSIRNFFQKK